MTAKVVLHLPARGVDNFTRQKYLVLFAEIKQLIEQRGGQVQAVERDPRLRNPAPQGHGDILNATDLHIIENGWVQQANALNAAIAYIPPYWHLDGQGMLFNSSIGGRNYRQKSVDFPAAMAFFKQMRRQKIRKRQSRYKQKSQIETLPEGAIAIFLQGGQPEKQGVAHCSTETMIRTVVAHAGGRKVVVKAHPISNQFDDAALIHRLLQEGLALIPTDANIHDILKACAVSVSFNSAVALEGMFHRKPAILFGKSDFHHFVQTVTDPAEFANALARALAQKNGFAPFLYWYFQQNCLSLRAPNRAAKILQIFAGRGFDAERLGLCDDS